MNAFKEQCIALRKQDLSITEIAKITGRNKSSIYFHIAAMPLSKERMKLYRDKSTERIKQFPLARKGKSLRPFKKFENWTPQTVLLLAHLSFDGEIARTRCSYNNRSEALIERVRKLMKLIYDFEPYTHENQLTGVHRIGYGNVELCAFLLEKKAELVEGINSFSKDLKREFLRAFFDDEGCMDFKLIKNYRRIRGYQKDVSILRVVQKLLADFDIQARVIMPNEVIIVGKEDLLRFQKEINFSPGVCVNGNRSNSVWKESLEKREILQRAIDSFKT